MIFDLRDYMDMNILFSPDYPGYKREVIESPNGDGVLDSGKKYCHIALKYNPPDWARDFLARAHFEACRVAEILDFDPLFYPRVEDGTLRILHYPIGVGTAEHTDFNLFTITCYRSSPDDVEQQPFNKWEKGVPAYHIGELGEIAGLGRATPHRVPGRAYSQMSIVYFAMPDHKLVLPPHPGIGGVQWEPGQTVKGWLADRYSRSRIYK